MYSMCFDIVVLPVFTCYGHIFYDNKTNNSFKHISHMQTKGLQIYNIFLLLNIYFVLNLNRGLSVTPRELNLRFQMASFLYDRVYASSRGF